MPGATIGFNRDYLEGLLEESGLLEREAAVSFYAEQLGAVMERTLHAWGVRGEIDVARLVSGKEAQRTRQEAQEDEPAEAEEHGYFMPTRGDLRAIEGVLDRCDRDDPLLRDVMLAGDHRAMRCYLGMMSRSWFGQLVDLALTCGVSDADLRPLFAVVDRRDTAQVGAGQLGSIRAVEAALADGPGIYDQRAETYLCMDGRLPLRADEPLQVWSAHVELDELMGWVAEGRGREEIVADCWPKELLTLDTSDLLALAARASGLRPVTMAEAKGHVMTASALDARPRPAAEVKRIR